MGNTGRHPFWELLAAPRTNVCLYSRGISSYVDRTAASVEERAGTGNRTPVGVWAGGVGRYFDHFIRKGNLRALIGDAELHKGQRCLTEYMSANTLTLY